MRHAEAKTSFFWSVADEDRPISKSGKVALLKAMPGLKGAGLGIDIILCSPYRRAMDTAKLVSELASSKKVLPVREMASGAKAMAYKTVVLRHALEGRLLLVGHMPDLIVFASFIIQNPLIIETGGFETAEMMKVETGPLEQSWGVGKILWRKKISEWIINKDL